MQRDTLAAEKSAAPRLTAPQGMVGSHAIRLLRSHPPKEIRRSLRDGWPSWCLDPENAPPNDARRCQRMHDGMSKDLWGEYERPQKLNKRPSEDF